jgi:hypothetical protein
MGLKKNFQVDYPIGQVSFIMGGVLSKAPALMTHWMGLPLINVFAVYKSIYL